MKAVVLAAGKGTRMRELTQEIPKPMLRVHGKPILEHILEGLRGAGISDVFIVTGFRADVVEDYFGDGKRLGLNVQYGRQLVQDGTGKAPELAKAFVGSDDFLLTYGDILVRPETYPEMLKRFREQGFSGLVTVTGSQDVTQGGLNFFDDAFCLTRLVEKPTHGQIEQLKTEGWLKPGATAWYNAGIYVFTPLLFEAVLPLTISRSPTCQPVGGDALTSMVFAFSFSPAEILTKLVTVEPWIDTSPCETMP